MSRIRTRVSCSIAVKLTVVAGGIGGQVIAGLTSPVLLFEESYPSISSFSFVDERHFLIIIPVDFQILSDLIGCSSTVMIFSCISSNMVTEGTGRRSSPKVGHSASIK